MSLTIPNCLVLNLKGGGGGGGEKDEILSVVARLQILLLAVISLEQYAEVLEVRL